MPATLYTAEYVLPGHPDKLCDAIADALVEQAARREKRALCGVEVAVHRATVFVTGRIACRDAETIDVPGIVRQVYASAGYDSLWRPSPEELTIRTDLCLGPLNNGEAEFRSLSDDQAIVTGYAVDLPATNYLPPEHWLACAAAQRLGSSAPSGPSWGSARTARCSSCWRLQNGRSRLAAFSASLHHAPGADPIQLHRAILELLAGSSPRPPRRFRASIRPFRTR